MAGSERRQDDILSRIDTAFVASPNVSKGPSISEGDTISRLDKSNALVIKFATAEKVRELTNTVRSSIGNREDAEVISALKNSAVGLLLVSSNKFLFSKRTDLQESFNELLKLYGVNENDPNIGTGYINLRDKALSHVLSTRYDILPDQLQASVDDIRGKYKHLKDKYKKDQKST